MKKLLLIVLIAGVLVSCGPTKKIVGGGDGIIITKFGKRIIISIDTTKVARIIMYQTTQTSKQ